MPRDQPRSRSLSLPPSRDPGKYNKAIIFLGNILILVGVMSFIFIHSFHFFKLINLFIFLFIYLNIFI